MHFAIISGRSSPRIQAEIIPVVETSIVCILATAHPTEIMKYAKNSLSAS